MPGSSRCWPWSKIAATISSIFAIVLGFAVLLATILHGIEASIWAVAYRLLGALPDAKTAMLYSLSAITSYGHAELYLEGRWQLMGALEALNGMLLFGLTTAFLYGIIQRVWPVENPLTLHRAGVETAAGSARCCFFPFAIANHSQLDHCALSREGRAMSGRAVRTDQKDVASGARRRRKSYRKNLSQDPAWK